MVKNLPAIRQFISPLEHRFISSETTARETLPALRAPTGSTSLVLYEKRLPERYFISGPMVAVVINKETDFDYGLPEEGDVRGMIRKAVSSIKERKACGSMRIFKLFRKEEQISFLEPALCIAGEEDFCEQPEFNRKEEE